jgi:hypothetical protein
VTRPTTGQVDAAIEHYFDEAVCAIERRCSDVLAAEVVALREDLGEIRVAARALLAALPPGPWTERTTVAVQALERLVRP